MQLNGYFSSWILMKCLFMLPSQLNFFSQIIQVTKFFSSWPWSMWFRLKWFLRLPSLIYFFPHILQRTNFFSHELHQWDSELTLALLFFKERLCFFTLLPNVINSRNDKRVYTTGIYFAYPWVSSFRFCLFTPIFANIKKLLIHGLEGLRICHKFQHQNLQNSQG